MKVKHSVTDLPNTHAAAVIIDDCPWWERVERARDLQDAGFVDAGNRLMKIMLMKMAQGRLDEE